MKKKRNNPAAMRCPYCGSPVILRSADGIYRENANGTMLYVCKRYPICDASGHKPASRHACQPRIALAQTRGSQIL